MKKKNKYLFYKLSLKALFVMNLYVKIIGLGVNKKYLADYGL